MAMLPAWMFLAAWAWMALGGVSDIFSGRRCDLGRRALQGWYALGEPHVDVAVGLGVEEEGAFEAGLLDSLCVQGGALSPVGLQGGVVGVDLLGEPGGLAVLAGLGEVVDDDGEGDGGGGEPEAELCGVSRGLRPKVPPRVARRGGGPIGRRRGRGGRRRKGNALRWTR